MNFARSATLGAGVVTGVALIVLALQFTQAQQSAQENTEPDPCEGQTDDVCHQTIDKLRAEGSSRYIEWVNDFLASGQDPAILPRHPSSASPPLLVANLATAVEEADAIVVGTVSEVTFEVVPPDDQSGYAFVQGTAQISIEDSLKGDLAQEVVVSQYGGPEPDPDWVTGHLLYMEAAPLLLKGDSAILFLVKDDLGYSVEPWTGTYFVGTDDKMNALTGNPFEASVEAQSLEEFSVVVKDLVAANHAGPQ